MLIHIDFSPGKLSPSLPVLEEPSAVPYNCVSFFLPHSKLHHLLLLTFADHVGICWTTWVKTPISVHFSGCFTLIALIIHSCLFLSYVELLFIHSWIIFPAMVIQFFKSLWKTFPNPCRKVEQCVSLEFALSIWFWYLKKVRDLWSISLNPTQCHIYSSPLILGF